MHVIQIFLHYLFYINGFQTIPRLPWLSSAIRICLISWYTAAMFLMFNRHLNKGNTSVGDFVGSASALVNGTINILIILETIFKSKHFDEMSWLQQEVDELLDVQLHLNIEKNIKFNCLFRRIFVIMLCQLICDAFKIWINSISKICPVFWYLLPISIGLRTRYLQIILDIMNINHRLVLFKDVVSLTAKASEPKSIYKSDIWQPYDPKDYEKINYMRLIYLRLWEINMSLNKLYSWSLLTLLMSSFFDIVCNCYWTFTAVYRRQVFHKYVMNGADSFSLASLVYLLLYFTNASEKNAAIIVLYLGYWIFGIVPFTNNYKIYTTFVTLWCCEITLTTYLAFTCHEFGGDGYTLNGLISIAFYITHMLGHLAILIESSARVQQRIELFERFSNIRNSFEEKLEASKELEIFAVRLSRIVIVILVMLACGHGCVMWTTLKTQSAACLLYWRFLQSYLALQFKTLEFLTGLLQINYYILIIRQTINAVGERNLKKVFQRLNKSPNATVIYITPQNEEEEEIDEQLLELLKNSYNEVYVTFLAYNSVYGWSLLFSTAVYFVDFVCNSYWILLAALTQGRDYYGLLQNASFALMAFVLIFLSCFYAEECYDESRYIGCLISKLVKPLGNKRYNDLVSEFSIQTLHQRFIITAKEFFSLNLSLLGSMVAAIVTYLVILIQFMFTEKDKTKDGWIYKSISFTLNTTSTFKTH